MSLSNREEFSSELPPGQWEKKLTIFGYQILRIWTRDENEYNRSAFQFEFLNFRMWDMSTFEFSIDFEIGVDGSRLAIGLPFLRMALTLLPCLDPHHKTWRTQTFPRGWSVDQRMDLITGLSTFELRDQEGKNIISGFKCRGDAVRWAKKNV